jgi:hypothetical protein
MKEDFNSKLKTKNKNFIKIEKNIPREKKIYMQSFLGKFANSDKYKNNQNQNKYQNQYQDQDQDNLFQTMNTRNKYYDSLKDKNLSSIKFSIPIDSQKNSNDFKKSISLNDYNREYGIERNKFPVSNSFQIKSILNQIKIDEDQYENINEDEDDDAMNNNYKSNTVSFYNKFNLTNNKYKNNLGISRNSFYGNPHRFVHNQKNENFNSKLDLLKKLAFSKKEN